MAWPERNLSTLQVLALLFMFDMTVPLRQTIYSQGGLGQAAIGVILAVPWVVILLTDVPTGRLADEYSYKRLIVAGLLLLGGGFLLLALSYGFWGYFSSAVLLGLGLSCYRGVPQALSGVTIGALHDPAAAKRYARFVQWGLTFAALGEAAASLVAYGIMREHRGDGLRIAIFAQVGICLLMAIIASWSLVDVRPAGTRALGFRTTLLSGWGSTIGGVKEVFHTVPLIRAIVLYGATIGCTTQTMVWLSQTYLQRTGTPTEQVPVIWAVYHVALLVFTFIIVPYEKLMGRWGALASLPLIATVAYLSLIWVQPKYGKWAVITFYFVRAMQMGIITVYLMTLVPEHMRATIAAVMNTLLYAFYSVMIVLVNLSVQLFPTFSHGTGVAFALSAVVYGPLGLVLVWYIRRHQKEATPS